MKPNRPPGPRLGELLDTRGRLSRDLLFEALRHQRANGARIGTCLVELEKISEDDLLHVLSDQLKVPFTLPEDLRSILPDTIKLIPEKVARQRFSIPLKTSSTHLTVAMRDPTDLLALDELAFVTGKRIRPQVASEIRMLEALARYYGVELASRYVKLLDRLNRERFFWHRDDTDGAKPKLDELPPLVVPPRELGAPTGEISGSWSGPATPSAPFSAGSDSTSSTGEILRPIVTHFAPAAESGAAAATLAPPTLAPTPAAPLAVPYATAPIAQLVPPLSATPPPPQPPMANAPTPPAPPPIAPPAAAPVAAIESPESPGLLSLADAEARLREPSGRDEVGAVLLEFARGRAASALVLMVRRDEAAGWLGFGPGLDDESVESCRVELLAPSFVRALREGASSHRGPLSEVPAHAEIRSMLSTNWATDLLALPLRVRDRLVSVIVVTLEDGVFTPESVEELTRLAGKASIALEQLVLRQKQSS